MSPPAVASALHLSEGTEITLLLTPGPAWANVSECAIIAWSGTKPTSNAQIKAALKAGTYAAVYITTWSPATVIGSPKALRESFQATVTALRKEGRKQIVAKAHGAVFKPHPLGASTVGWKTSGASPRQARALWFKSASLRIMQIDVLASGKLVPTASVDRIAATAVPAFGL
jgi:hypothetical protein